jgi:uncharacterized protein YyaL (SSP411 family)
MLATVYQRYIPNRVVWVGQAGTEDLPLTRGKVCVDGRPTGYVCHSQTCSPPATDAHQLEAML